MKVLSVRNEFIVVEVEAPFLSREKGGGESGFVEEFVTKRSAARGRFGRNDFHHGLLEEIRTLGGVQWESFGVAAFGDRAAALSTAGRGQHRGRRPGGA